MSQGTAYEKLMQLFTDFEENMSLDTTEWVKETGEDFAAGVD